MEFVRFLQSNGRTVAIPKDKITGVVEYKDFETFIATGADGADGAENGFYVSVAFREVMKRLEK